MNNNLLIVGAGMYGYVVKEVAEAMNCFDKIYFLDDSCRRDDVIGRIDECDKFLDEYSNAFVAIGNASLRKEFMVSLKSAGYNLPILVHPKAHVSKSAKLGEGCVVEPLAVVHANSVVGAGCIVSAGAIVNHNATVGNLCHIECNATIMARADIPDETKVRAGEIVL